MTTCFTYPTNRILVTKAAILHGASPDASSISPGAAKIAAETSCMGRKAKSYAKPDGV